ncbi:MAG: hypothetical protein N4A59_13865 [Marinifilum sp.]|jgi:hypothetical protein|nr:hypothetical protein [Marinifilum sp.]
MKNTMETSKEGMYRIELINLEGDVVYLNIDSLNQFCQDTLPENLPDEAYTVKISGNDEEDLFEKLLVVEEY